MGGFQGIIHLDYVGIRLYGSSLISPIMDDITTYTICGAEAWPMKHRNTDNVIWYTVRVWECQNSNSTYA